jgi:hypothetical protein
MRSRKMSKKFVRRELKKENFTHPDAIRVVRAWWVVHTDTGGYTEDELDFHLWKDGSITISDTNDDQFISISGEMLDILRDLLGKRPE